MSTDRPSPRISIIIPAFNDERYIGASLASVLNQTCEDYEVIVVDDGSTDATRAIVLESRGPIRYIYQPNQGPAAARNTGINAAIGELVCFLDADDSWFPDKLAIQLQFMDQNAAVGLVFADEEEFDDHGVQCRSLVSTSRFYPAITAAPVIDDAFRKLLEENFIPTSMVMVRRSCFESTGLFDVALKGPEDRDLWSRIAVRFPVAFIPRVLGRKRVVAASVSRDIETTLRSRIVMWTKIRGLFPALAPGRTINALLAPTYLQLGFVLLEKGRAREARHFALKSLAVSRHPSLWLQAASLVVLTCIGKTGTDFAFESRRRLRRSWRSRTPA
jgi:glycosyltransferase involved in cell wall biosynthesis